ncbi:MAG: CerR family C-terminal domain-containing protein [Verrucomicrobiaceae bacterium]
MPAKPKTQAPRASRTDGEATSTRILETAGELFAASGFAETSSKAIAAQSGVDLASINYHFGSRGGLYQAVLAEAHRHFISMETLEELSAAKLPARDKLKKIIAGMVVAATSKQSWHIRVLGRELMSPTSHLQILQQNEIFPKFRVVIGILSEITAIPPDDPALFRCAISVAAPCAMMLVVGRNAPFLADAIDRTPPETLAAHLFDFAIGGLKAIGQKHPKPAK